MKNVTRTKELIIAGALALAKWAGATILATFLTGAGTAATVEYVIITNWMIKQAKM